MSNAYYKRQFLNTEEYGGTAFVEAMVGELSPRSGIDASLTIADCNRQINLDFSVYRVEDISNQLGKLRRLKSAIAGLEGVLREQIAALEKSKGAA